jgi:hypothetical protein
MSTAGKAQSIINLSIVPANPTETDTIFLVSTTNFGVAPNTIEYYWVTENDNVITVSAHHQLGMAFFPEPSTDIMLAGNFGSGEYQLIYQVQESYQSIPIIIQDTLFFTVQESTDDFNCDSIVEQNIPLILSEGWNMIGYTCVEPLNVIEAFSSVEDKIIIVKDNLGNAYLPEFGYNGIGNLEFAKGYQLKITEDITDFYFCPTLIQTE